MFLWSLLLLAGVPADLVVTNAKVWTGWPSQPWAEAVAIRGSQIVEVGTTTEVKTLIGPQTNVLDAKGKVLMAGFNDAHIHFLSGSLRLNEVDLTGVCTLASIQSKIKDWAASHPDAAWITGGGWEYTCFPEKRLPTRKDLDAIAPSRPVFLRAYDGHTAWVNTRALQLAGVTKETKFSGFGEVVTEPETGEPAGTLKEGAMRLVGKLLPIPTRAEKLAALEKGLQLAASLGITSIQNASGDRDEIGLYAELVRDNKLTLRAAFALSMGPGCDEIADLKGRWVGPLLKVAAVKFMLDGVIETHTAAMLSAYADKKDTSGGLARLPEEYKEAVKACHDAGWQVQTHAIGDRAVRTALDAYELLTPSARPRIEHIEVIHTSDRPRFSRLGVIASMMPIHADPNTVEVWSQAVGVDRMNRAFPWGGLQRAGARLVFSSDWPASISLDPLRGIHTAVTRMTLDGSPQGGWYPDQRVTLTTALQGYTSAAAFAEREEHKKGQVREGFLADLVILSRNPFELPAPMIGKTRVEYTIFDGKVIYRRQNSAPAP